MLLVQYALDNQDLFDVDQDTGELLMPLEGNDDDVDGDDDLGREGEDDDETRKRLLDLEATEEGTPQKKRKKSEGVPKKKKMV